MRVPNPSNANSRPKTFGILGAGHVGIGLAADLEHRGHQAVLYAHPQHRRILNKIAAQGHIEAVEALQGIFHPAIVTEIGDLISCTNTLVIAVPSSAHDEVVELLKPHKFELHRKNIIFITGNGVAPLAQRQLNLHNVFETSRAPYTVRIEEHPHNLIKIRINGFKKRTVLAGLHPPPPSTRTEFRTLFGMPCIWYDNLLQLLLVENHGLLHAPTMLRNQQAIREKRSMFFYRDGMNPSVCSEMLRADAELASLAQALGVEQRETLLETLNGDYGTHYPNLPTFVTQISALNKRPGLPTSMQSRQITQDVQMLAVLWASMATALGVRTPTMDSWIDEACEINGVDYRKTGRTLRTFGLGEGASAKDIRAVFGSEESSVVRRM